MIDFKKVKAGRLSNPIPENLRIFKCHLCHQHKYFTDKILTGYVCKGCSKEKTDELPTHEDALDLAEGSELLGNSEELGKG